MLVHRTIIEDTDDKGENRVAPGAPVAYALTAMTTPVRTWWAWRRERSGSLAC
jgi:hypothetical protein